MAGVGARPHHDEVTNSDGGEEIGALGDPSLRGLGLSPQRHLGGENKMVRSVRLELTTSASAGLRSIH